MSDVMSGSIRMVLLATAVGVLAACGNLSRDVARDGGSAGQLAWPAQGDTVPVAKDGIFPNRANLALVKAGLNKPQISALIGYPHFNEGVWGVREWNYLFHFRDAATDAVTTCEFKVLFDEQKLARSFYWNPESCARYQQADVAVAPVPAPVADAPPAELVLSADALFAFDSASLSERGKAQLDRFAQQLAAQGDQLRRVDITGYTDRLGGDAHNENLSRRRAEAVRDRLLARGVPPAALQAEGRGKADPVKSCPASSKDALIACLAPNRRVVVRVVTGTSGDGAR
ncbi:OmpA family protein [Dyella sp. 2RAB6]|uniref:OmpA family protein n=1 Tax=Dyella sp. 2RAB6 TaxID=3232992 RepID=UPI003F915E45